MPRVRFRARRKTEQKIPVILGVVILVFTIMHFTPRDPARNILGEYALQSDVNVLHEQMRPNDPFFVQLGRYLRNLLLYLDLGTSYKNNQPVLPQNHREVSSIPHQHPKEAKIGRDITFDLNFASNSGFCA
ncbi:MAG: hypothetical protein LBQ42_13745 [Synergistaceae bacterium]|nr:hypothetical protein [Synergistaceae bacterium]